jgi:predicted phosphoribosyltransferase
MYFTNRAQAGGMLAAQLEKYRFENTIVVALSEGGVLVGEPIAQYVHAVLTMLLSEEITVPGENTAIGSIDQDGGFSYNSELSAGQMDEYQAEYLNYFEGQKMEKFHEMNQLLGDGGILDKDMLRDHSVVLVSDGLKGTSQLDAAASFLKPIRIQRLVVVAPIASVAAVDRLHIMADELHILNVADNYLDTDHYYDDNTIPSREEIVAKINQAILNWH